jgi:subtilisin family serine protease
MKRSTRLFAVLAAVIAAFPLVAPAAEKDYVVVARGQGRGSTALDDRIVAAQGHVQHRWDELGVIVATSANPGFAAAVAVDPRVSGVSEDIEMRWLPREPARLLELGDTQPQSGESEPGAVFQWNLRRIGADVAATHGFRGAGGRVAVLDSGFWVHHPDLEANVNIALSRSFVPEEQGIEPVVGGFSHGTHVAGIIAAPINGIGIQGVAPEAEIVGIKVLRSTTGSGALSWILNGILYAVAIEADVINLSLGTTIDRISQGGGSGPLVAALNRAVNHATASGVLVVSAAGNDAVDLNGRLWAIPAQSGGSMAVSATAPVAQHDFDRPASYTNYGQSVVDVAAPGGDLVAGGMAQDLILAPGGRASPTGAYEYYFAGGTSMAAPHVSAFAALLVGAFGQMSPAQLRSIIERSAEGILRPGAGRFSGRGRIDVAKAFGLE